MSQVEGRLEELPREGEAGGARGHMVRFLLLGAVVALAVGYMIYAAFPGNTQYFMTVGEFLQGEQYQDGRTLRVSGKLVQESFQRQGVSTLSYFQLSDQSGPPGRNLRASYVGVMPDLFFNPHSEIILEGRTDSRALPTGRTRSSKLTTSWSSAPPSTAPWKKKCRPTVSRVAPETDPPWK